MLYVQFFFVFLGATACSAISPVAQTFAGLAGYPRRGLNPHLPLELGPAAEADETSFESVGGALTIRPRRRCTHGRPAKPAAGVEHTYPLSMAKGSALTIRQQAGTIWSHGAHASPYAAGNGAPPPLDCTGVVGLALCAGVLHARCERGLAIANRIPFGDHPLKLERYRED